MSTDVAQLDRLELLLSTQVAGLTALRNWLPRKKDLIQNHKLSELEAFTLREEEHVGRLAQAESQRQVLVGMIGRDLGLEVANPSLNDLLPCLDRDRAERLTAHGTKLRLLTEEIQIGQHEVAELLRVSLEYVHHTMDLFAQLATAAPATGYGGGGDVSEPSIASWLVNQRA